MNSVYDLDRNLFLLVHSRWRVRWLDPVMIWFTKAGTKGAVWLGLAAGLALGSEHARVAAALTIIALLLAEGMTNLVLKPAVQRQRPYTHHGLAALLVKAPGPHSWPSAHAASSVAAGSVLAVAYFPLGILFLLGALVIAYSRVYVGVHYPLDVLAGAVLGAICAAVTLLVYGALRIFVPI